MKRIKISKYDLKINNKCKMPWQNEKNYTIEEFNKLIDKFFVDNPNEKEIFINCDFYIKNYDDDLDCELVNLTLFFRKDYVTNVSHALKYFQDMLIENAKENMANAAKMQKEAIDDINKAYLITKIKQFSNEQRMTICAEPRTTIN